MKKIIKAYAIWVVDEERFGVILAGDAPYAIFAAKENAQANNKISNRKDDNYIIVPVEISIVAPKNKKK